jgi:hypothetical protein
MTAAVGPAAAGKDNHGGGGGWFGGGGGGSGDEATGGGGGASGYAAPGLSATLTPGVRSGDGQVTITHEATSPVPEQRERRKARREGSRRTLENDA